MELDRCVDRDVIGDFIPPDNPDAFRGKFGYVKGPKGKIFVPGKEIVGRHTDDPLPKKGSQILVRQVVELGGEPHPRGKKAYVITDGPKTTRGRVTTVSSDDDGNPFALINDGGREAIKADHIALEKCGDVHPGMQVNVKSVKADGVQSRIAISVTRA